MAEICKNCAHEIAINFCSNCGQKKAKRIDRTYIKDEIQYTVFHMNKGFFYSIKKILRAPGKTAREFLDGNRVNHYKPLLLAFVVSGISAFIANTFIHPDEIMNNAIVTNPTPGFDQRAYNTFIYKYQSLMMLAGLPIMAFFTWIAFKKWGYNYYENIVLNAFYMICLQTLSILIVVPFQLVLKNDPTLFLSISFALSMVLMIGVGLWFYIQLYNNKSAGDVILRLFLMVVIGFILFFVLIFVIAFAIAILSPNLLPKPVTH